MDSTEKKMDNDRDLQAIAPMEIFMQSLIALTLGIRNIDIVLSEIQNPIIRFPRLLPRFLLRGLYG